LPVLTDPREELGFCRPYVSRASRPRLEFVSLRRIFPSFCFSHSVERRRRHHLVRVLYPPQAMPKYPIIPGLDPVETDPLDEDPDDDGGARTRARRRFWFFLVFFFPRRDVSPLERLLLVGRRKLHLRTPRSLEAKAEVPGGGRSPPVSRCMT